MSDTLFVYVNPGFNAAHGHYASHAARVWGHVVATGIGYLHVTHASLAPELAHEHFAVPFFEHRPHESVFGRKHEAREPMADFREKMTRLFRAINRGRLGRFRRIVCYFYSGHPRYAEPLAEALRNGGPWRCDLAFHLNFLYAETTLVDGQPEPELEECLERSGRALEEADQTGAVRLHSDSPFIAALYARYFRRPVSLLPAPISLPPFSLWERVDHWKFRLDLKTRNGLRRPLVVCYMGYPHPKWGYDLVEQCYRRLRAQPPTRDVQFCVRHQTLHLTATFRELMDRWLAETDAIVHSTGFLDAHNYARFLSTADIVIIPYAREHYPVQTSGVFIESLSIGKVVIAPAKTWLGDVIERTGCGVTFDSGNADSLEVAVRTAVADFGVIAPRARTTGRLFNSYWTVRNLFSFLGVPSGLPPVRLSIYDAN